MSSSRVETEVRSALVATHLLHPLSSRSGAGKVEILCRQLPGMESPWLQMLDKLLTTEEKGLPGELHICRRYVRSNGMLAFGWHVQLEAKSVKDLEVLAKVVLEVLNQPTPRVEPLKPDTTTQQVAQGSGPRIEVTRRWQDSKGRPHVEESMPLPHVDRDLNVPNAKGRGATGFGGGE